VEEIKYESSGGLTVVDYRITCKTRLPESNL
jgi:hypothetical protein